MTREFYGAVLFTPRAVVAELEAVQTPSITYFEERVASINANSLNVCSRWFVERVMEGFMATHMLGNTSF